MKVKILSSINAVYLWIYIKNILIVHNKCQKGMYWDCSGRILRCLNSSLQESLGLDPLLILTAFFWSWKMCGLYEELPQKTIQ